MAINEGTLEADVNSLEHLVHLHIILGTEFMILICPIRFFFDFSFICFTAFVLLLTFLFLSSS